MLATQSPFPQYFDPKDGSPLDNGKLYFGQANQNPVTAPITVYWDAAGTQPAAQPIQTLNGYTVRNGAPAIVYAAGNYSLLVNDKRGRQVLYARDSSAFGNAEIISGLIDALRADLANTSDVAKGSALSGFNGHLNYVANTIGWAVSGLEIDPRWFGLKGDWNGTTGTDDTVALQAAINFIPSGGTGAISLPRNSDCSITASLVVSNRNVLFEGDQSTITLTSNIGTDFLFEVSGTNCEFRNLSINKKAGVTAAGALSVTGLQHVFRNITSRDQKWTTFFHGVDLKESHFHDIRVDLDVTVRAGDIFKLDYCVNNTWDSCFIGFANQGFYCTSATHPTFGYACEGISLTNVIGVYCKKAITADRVTALTVGSGCVLDFCDTWGVFATNGDDLTVAPGVWIAANGVNGFIGVGTGASFTNAKIQGANITAGVAITGSAFSLSGPRAIVTGNNIAGALDGGIVTDASSRVYGNTVASPGTAISTPNGNAGPGDSGNWTPTILFGGAAVGITYTTQAGVYTKTGNEVVARMRLTLSSKGTSVGAFQIVGLPFANNSAYYGSVLVTRQVNMATAAAPCGQVQLSSATAVIFSNAAPGTALDNTAFNNNSTIDAEIQYQI
jgi:hypothetical protein